MKSNFKSDFSQHERLALFISALKKGTLYNSRTFSEYLSKYKPQLKCSQKTIKRDVALLINDYSCPLNYDRSLHAYVLLNKEWVLPTGEYKVPLNGLLESEEKLKSATVMISGILRESLVSASWCHKMKLVDTVNYKLVYRLRFTNTQLLKAWVFDNFGKARILSPESLRDEIAKAALVIGEEHSGPVQQEVRDYLSFAEAKGYVVSLNLSSVAQWEAFCESGKKPNNIPVAPEVVYKNDGWIDYDDWLGILRARSGIKDSLSFVEARKLVRGLRLHSKDQYRIACENGRIPRSISFAPEKFYKEWEGYEDWLGLSE